MKQILVELQEAMGSDESICNAAWTSTYNKSTREDKYDDPEKVASLVPRLIKDGHATPLESVVFRFWYRHPIFSDRQHVTHRIASHNGLSGRYRTMPSDYYHIPDDVLAILDKIPVGSNYFEKNYNRVCDLANDVYKSQITLAKTAETSGQISNTEYKRVREILRGQLPQSGMTERTTVMNLRSFANYQKLRNSDHAQPEIRYVAQMMLEEVKKAGVAPIAIQTLEEIGWKI